MCAVVKSKRTQSGQAVSPAGVEPGVVGALRVEKGGGAKERS